MMKDKKGKKNQSFTKTVGTRVVLIMFSTEPPCQSNNSPHLSLYLHETKHTNPDCHLFFNPSSRIQTFKISPRDQSTQLFINMGSFRLGKSLWWATPLV